MRWPLFDLRVRTPTLELRVPTDDDLTTLAAEVALGIHDPEWMPFLVPWTKLPSPELERQAMQYHWRCRADWKPEAWRLELAVVRDGVPVGLQGAHGDDFGRLRQVVTGSWLGRRHQGMGIGKEMRAAILHLVFEGLGAQRALSSAREDNAPSIGVSRALGYEDNGFSWNVRDGEVTRDIGFVLSRERWQRRDDIVIEGLEPCLPLFGVPT